MVEGSILVSDSACGPILVSDTGLSFWGGVDPTTGDVIDQHHPLFDSTISGCVLAIPNGRGSCSDSGALLELILNDCAPAALLFSEAEDILTLGVLVAEAFFQHSFPILRLSRKDFNDLGLGTHVAIRENQLYVGLSKGELSNDVPSHQPKAFAVYLNTSDKDVLAASWHLRVGRPTGERPL